ncbi:uncharacterized protein KD926_008809 [Aspergillus affinis]|uniref:uncharacterized protein n=1 Tax=Aspergillus affinis TaxID=1070780 RepID=UPI0022FF1578|nr:uncharacterized protein KD926_008809 [Aspergillus affinis]KAI9045382.1 hypothetical protein KD926_008809 [Aspergillus affinis]
MVLKSSKWQIMVLIMCSSVTSTTMSYDGSLLNGLNILPSYQHYFAFNPSSAALYTASTWIGTLIASIFCAKISNHVGRKRALLYGSLLAVISVIIQTASQNVAMYVTSRIVLGISAGTQSIAWPVEIKGKTLEEIGEILNGTSLSGELDKLQNSEKGLDRKTSLS